jgi:gamma-glutamyltranspeptidase / glutathione hydrolase
LATAFLAACGPTKEERIGVIGSVEGAIGGAASDEPRATLVAQDVLSAGGTAADAATALYFTLSVTYPIAGSLGGGGECLVYDNKSNKIENLKFPIGAPKQGGDIGVPGNIRGMAALHARYGRLPWGQLLSPAEKFANFGENISRAQHVAMSTAGSKVRLDSLLSELYKTENGGYKAEGTRIQQIKLSSILTTLRSNGGAFFYGGALSRAFVDEANAAGGKLQTSDLVYYRPQWVPAKTFEAGINTVGVVSGVQGDLYEEMWTKLFVPPSLIGAQNSVSAKQLRDASASSFQKYTGYNPFGTGGTTSFVTSDRLGNAVSCTIGLGKPFGSGRMGRISGIVLAPVLPENQSEFPTSPVIVINRPNANLYLAAAATGGAAGTMGSVYTAVQLLSVEKSLENSIKNPRIFTMGEGLPLLYEKNLSSDEIKAASQGHPVTLEVQKLGSVNAIFCYDGKINACESRVDPRGFGLSLIRR